MCRNGNKNMNSDQTYADLMANGTLSNPNPWMTCWARKMAYNIINYSKIKTKSCLDLGCGIGTLVASLEKNGFTCLGVDKNPNFIEKAKQISESEFEISDIANYKSGKKWGVVSATHQAFNIIDWNICLDTMISNLEETGFLIFDMITPLGFQTWQDVQIQEHDDFFMLQKCFFDGNEGKLKLTGFVKSQCGTYNRFDITGTVYNHCINTVIERLKSSNFNVEIYGDLTPFENPIQDFSKFTSITVVANRI